MRTARFRDAAGRIRTGEWTDTGIVHSGTRYDVDDVDVQPPVTPTKIFGVAVNHTSFIEANDDKWSPPECPSDRPQYIKPPTVTVGHRDTILIPKDGEILSEIELGVVIGEQCRNVAREDAMDVVGGFTVVNDITNSAREHSVRKKAIDNAAPMGPVVASPDVVPADATMEARINEEVTQHADRSDYTHSAAVLIEELTTNLTFEPGDVIVMGTPKGYSQVTHGDHIELFIEGIGTLKNDVEFY